MAPRDGLKFLSFGRASAGFAKLREFSPSPLRLYLLQCLVAFTGSKSTVQKLAILVLAAALAFITVFAVPAS